MWKLFQQPQHCCPKVTDCLFVITIYRRESCDTTTGSPVMFPLLSDWTAALMRSEWFCCPGWTCEVSLVLAWWWLTIWETANSGSLPCRAGFYSGNHHLYISGLPQGLRKAFLSFHLFWRLETLKHFCQPCKCILMIHQLHFVLMKSGNLSLKSQLFTQKKLFIHLKALSVYAPTIKAETHCQWWRHTQYTTLV